MSEICLNGSEITAENIFDIAYNEETKIKIDNSSQEKVNAAQKLILKAQNGRIPVYGLTRDVGQFKNESLQNKSNYDMDVLADHSTTIGKRVIKNVKILLNRSSRRKRGMVSNPLFTMPDSFLYFPNELCYGYLRFEGDGKIPLGR